MRKTIRCLRGNQVSGHLWKIATQIYPPMMPNVTSVVRRYLRGYHD